MGNFFHFRADTGGKDRPHREYMGKGFFVVFDVKVMSNELKRFVFFAGKHRDIVIYYIFISCRRVLGQNRTL